MGDEMEIASPLMWTGGSKLRQARIRQGYTQFEFAAKLGAAESTIRAWEKNKRVPRWNRAKKEAIAQILNLSLEEIMSWFESSL